MLIIYTHPNKKGTCGYVFKKLKKKLKGYKKDFKVIDLYKDEFNPVLAKNELYTHSEKEIEKKAQKYQKLLKKHDEIIIIYPTWWNAAPAILKGFFDKVLTPGFAFKYENKLPKGLLSGKVAVITTSGGPSIYQALIAKNRSLKTITNDTLKFCGYNTSGYLISSANKLNEKTEKKSQKVIKKIFSFFDI